ncbi:MAG: hypothetical protein ACTSRW_03175, partial [Candidatus Helarchaeota archaeon]
GISGYRIKKNINLKLKESIDGKDEMPFSHLSQSLVYRALKLFKEKKLIDEEKTVINNRNQILYKMNDKGKKRLEYLERAIQNLSRGQMSQEEFVENIMTGKISPFDLMQNHLRNLPKEEILKILTRVRDYFKKEITKLDERIFALKKELKEK